MDKTHIVYLMGSVYYKLLKLTQTGVLCPIQFIILRRVAKEKCPTTTAKLFSCMIVLLGNTCRTSHIVFTRRHEKKLSTIQRAENQVKTKNFGSKLERNKMDKSFRRGNKKNNISISNEVGEILTN